MPSFCRHCGQPLPDDARFCPSCGSSVSEQAPGAPPAAATGVSSTTASLDAGALDPVAELDGVPTLAQGTGLLVVVRGPNAGSRYLLDRDVTTIGRHPEAHIFLDDVTVSRHHCEVRRRPEGSFLAADMGSLNGTYVNGEIAEERVLAAGDELQVGRFKLMLVTALTDVEA